MAFDFPNTPTEGQVFSPAGGPVYVYTGGVWRMQASLGVTGSPFKRSVYTSSSTTFQYDASTLYADVEVQGGGGSGGGTGSGSGAGWGSAGGGGAAGGYAKKLIQITGAIRAATKTITIGAGAAGSSVGGGTGGTTTYTDTVNTLTGNGGTGGTAGAFSANMVLRAGIGGGGATGGDINMTGMPGHPGLSYGATNCGAGIASALAGNGGSSPFGTGGAGGGGGASSSVFSGPGSPGGIGAGSGGGAALNAVGSAVVSAAGGVGAVVITEYR